MRAPPEAETMISGNFSAVAASMARVVEALKPEDKRVPILASPGIAIDHLATIL